MPEGQFPQYPKMRPGLKDGTEIISNREGLLVLTLNTNGNEGAHPGHAFTK